MLKQITPKVRSEFYARAVASINPAQLKVEQKEDDDF